MVMYGKITYQKIKRPDYLEYTQIFCDKEGHLSRHPMVPVWPEKMLTQVYFYSEGEKQTRVTVVWQPEGKVSGEERQAFTNMRGGMSQGWSEAFDKLDETLEQRP